MATYQVLRALGLQPIVRPVCGTDWESFLSREPHGRRYHIKVGPGFKHYHVDTKEPPAGTRDPVSGLSLTIVNYGFLTFKKPVYVPDPFQEWSAVYFFNRPVYDEMHEVSLAVCIRRLLSMDLC